MAVILDNLNLKKCTLGNTNVQKIYRGGDLVWPVTQWYEENDGWGLNNVRIVFNCNFMKEDLGDTNPSMDMKVVNSNSERDLFVLRDHNKLMEEFNSSKGYYCYISPESLQTIGINEGSFSYPAYVQDAQGNVLMQFSNKILNWLNYYQRDDDYAEWSASDIQLSEYFIYNYYFDGSNWYGWNSIAGLDLIRISDCTRIMTESAVYGSDEYITINITFDYNYAS